MLHFRIPLNESFRVSVNSGQDGRLSKNAGYFYGYGGKCNSFALYGNDGRASAEWGCSVAKYFMAIALRNERVPNITLPSEITIIYRVSLPCRISDNYCR